MTPVPAVAATPAQLEASVRAEARAVEYGAHAWLNDDGSIRVRSESEPGVWHTVRYHGVAGGLVRFECDCQAGVARTIPDGLVGCWHAACAARSTHLEPFVRWVDGWWRLTERAEALPAPAADPASCAHAVRDNGICVECNDDDPFYGLPGQAVA